MISNTSIKQFLLIVIIMTLGILIFYQLRNHISAFLGAYTLYILLKKWQLNLVQKKKWKASWAATVLIIFSILVIVLPINALLMVLVKKLVPFMNNYPQMMANLEQSVQHIEQNYNIEILTQDNLKTAGDWMGKELQSMLGATFSGAFGVTLMFFVLYYMLTEQKVMEKKLFRLLPISTKSVAYLKEHLNSLVFSNAVGIPLVALLQGFLGFVIYWILGVPDTILWFAATCIGSMIPVVGAMIIYVPLAIMLFMQGNTTGAVILLLYGFLIIGTADNVFRFWLQKKIGDTHPLITIFGVIVGLNIFGFIGLVFGPILFSLLILFYEIYEMEYVKHVEKT